MENLSFRFILRLIEILFIFYSQQKPLQVFRHMFFDYRAETVIPLYSFWMQFDAKYWGKNRRFSLLFTELKNGSFAKIVIYSQNVTQFAACTVNDCQIPNHIDRSVNTPYSYGWWDNELNLTMAWQILDFNLPAESKELTLFEIVQENIYNRWNKWRWNKNGRFLTEKTTIRKYLFLFAWFKVSTN